MDDRVRILKRPQTAAQDWASKWNYSKYYRVSPAISFLHSMKESGIVTERLKPLVNEAIEKLRNLFSSMDDAEGNVSKEQFVSNAQNAEYYNERLEEYFRTLGRKED